MGPHSTGPLRAITNIDSHDRLDTLSIDGVSIELVEQGAEARIYRAQFSSDDEQYIVKQRFSKTYRHPEVDKSLRRRRTKAEHVSLERASKAGVNVPNVKDFSETVILMEFIDAHPISIVFQSLLNRTVCPATSAETTITVLLSQMATSVAKLHANNIVHGDLTTLNFLLKRRCNLESCQSEEQLINDISKSLFVIDFGLASFSRSAEDKAVDLYVLERAIRTGLVSSSKSTDRLNVDTEELFREIFLKTYHSAYEAVPSAGKKQDSSAGDSMPVLLRLKAVRARGRKREMVG